MGRERRPPVTARRRSSEQQCCSTAGFVLCVDSGQCLLPALEGNLWMDVVPVPPTRTTYVARVSCVVFLAYVGRCCCLRAQACFWREFRVCAWTKRSDTFFLVKKTITSFFRALIFTMGSTFGSFRRIGVPWYRRCVCSDWCGMD